MSLWKEKLDVERATCPGEALGAVQPLLLSLHAQTGEELGWGMSFSKLPKRFSS